MHTVINQQNTKFILVDNIKGVIMESFTLKEIIFSLRKEYLQNQKKLF